MSERGDSPMYAFLVLAALTVFLKSILVALVLGAMIVPSAKRKEHP